MAILTLFKQMYKYAVYSEIVTEIRRYMSMSMLIMTPNMEHHFLIRNYKLYGIMPTIQKCSSFLLCAILVGESVKC